jgi:hypothetical protein
MPIDADAQVSDPLAGVGGKVIALAAPELVAMRGDSTGSA